jgi:hypothetical protein
LHEQEPAKEDFLTERVAEELSDQRPGLLEDFYADPTICDGELLPKS